jgi:hypothetical protein
MKKALSFIVLSLLVLSSLGSTVYAAKPQKGPGGGGGNAVATKLGNDISWPQCGRSLPGDFAFGIVGVTGGTAATTNPCLAEQLTWAKAANGSTTQAKTQLYVNTANPGEVIDQITTWPTSGTDRNGVTPSNPYGTNCSGANDLACSWMYGWNRALEAHLDRFVPAANAASVSSNPADYPWWLDVETQNTWQSGSSQALARNTASLEGMAAYFQQKGATVGLYSTSYQWNQVVGSTVSSTSNLNGLVSWLAGGRSEKNAKSLCDGPALTAGGTVSLTQYIAHNLDYDYSCRG